MSEQGPHDQGPGYAEFFNEQRRIEIAARDDDLQLAVRYFYEVWNAPHSRARAELFQKARARLDIAIQAVIWGYNLHPTHWSRLVEEANEYMMRNKR